MLKTKTSTVKGACQACVQHAVIPKFSIVILGIQGWWSLSRSLGMFKVHPFKESLDALRHSQRGAPAHLCSWVSLNEPDHDVGGDEAGPAPSAVCSLLRTHPPARHGLRRGPGQCHGSLCATIAAGSTGFKPCGMLVSRLISAAVLRGPSGAISSQPRYHVMSTACSEACSVRRF